MKGSATKILFGITLFILSFSLQASAVIIEQIAIRVNDDIVTQLEFNEIWNPFADAGYSSVQRSGIIKMLVTFEVFNQMAEEQNILVSLESIDEQIQRTFRAQGLRTRQEQIVYLTENGIPSYPYFLRQQRYMMTLENYISAIQSNAGADPNAPSLISDVPEEDIEEYFELHRAEFEQPEERRISHILILKADPSKVEDAFAVNREKRARAQEILEKLKNGAGFRAMVEDYSQDPESVTEGGDLGWFTQDTLNDLADRLNMTGITPIIFNKEENELTEVIDSKLGFHIFRVDEIKDAMDTRFEQVRSRIRAYLERQRYIELIEERLNEQVNQAQISINIQ